MRAARGFTLIEMVVVIAVLGLLMTILIGITRALVSQQRYATTRARMANVDTALVVYVSTNKRLPCPAEGRTPSGAAGAGNEAATVAAGMRTCNNNQQYGVVPWAALGLSATDAEDGWGHRFTYRVGPDMVRDSGMDFTNCDPAGTNTTVATAPPFCNITCASGSPNLCTTPLTALTGSNTKGVVIEDASGNVVMDPRTSPSTGAAYVLVGHGPEGGGAYDGNGILQSSAVSAGTAEAKNFADLAYNPPTPAISGYLVDSTINGTSTTSHFDDMLSRPGILALATKAQVGPRSH